MTVTIIFWSNNSFQVTPPHQAEFAFTTSLKAFCTTYIHTFNMIVSSTQEIDVLHSILFFWSKQNTQACSNGGRGFTLFMAYVFYLLYVVEIMQLSNSFHSTTCSLLPHPQQPICPLPHVDMEDALHPSAQCIELHQVLFIPHVASLGHVSYNYHIFKHTKQCTHNSFLIQERWSSFEDGHKKYIEDPSTEQLLTSFSAQGLKTALEAEYGPALKMLHKLVFQPSLEQTLSTLHQYPPPRQPGCKPKEPAALPNRLSKPLPAPREPQLPKLENIQTNILWGIRVNFNTHGTLVDFTFKIKCFMCVTKLQNSRVP